MSNYIAKARRAAELIEHHRDEMAKYARVRAENLAEARKTMEPQEIADALGVTRSAVYKILREVKS